MSDLVLKRVRLAPNGTNLILKSSRFIAFGVNLTHFGAKSVILALPRITYPMSLKTNYINSMTVGTG